MNDKNHDENEKQDNPKIEEGPSATVTIPEADLEKLQAEAKEYKDKYLRLLAESDNMRKRMQKEKLESIQYGIQSVIVDFLNPLDHLESALGFSDQMSGEVKNWAMGFQMILSQFKDVLNRNGVVPFQSEGTPFDPHHHEAVETVATNDVPPGMVIAESLKGYRMGDRTIRPARVKVSKAPEKVKEPLPNGNVPPKE